jgi:hypothetical protein
VEASETDVASPPTRLPGPSVVRCQSADATPYASTERSYPPARYGPGRIEAIGGQPPARAPIISSVIIAEPAATRLYRFQPPGMTTSIAGAAARHRCPNSSLAGISCTPRTSPMAARMEIGM